MATLFSASSASAFLNPCDLRAKPVDVGALGISDFGVLSYQQKLDQECALYKKYSSVRSKVAQFGANLEDISLYQVLRYVERDRYENAAATEIPVELIYQTTKAGYKLPQSQQSAEIWRNFAVGIRSLEPARDALMSGTPFTLKAFQAIHRGFYTESCESGDFAHIPNPGEFRPQQKNGNPWWKFDNLQAAQTAKAAVDLINAGYDNMALVPNVDTEDHDREANYPLRVILEKLEIHSGDDRINPIHMKNLMVFLNKMMDQGRQNQHMVWRGRLLTPTELAFFVQQFYVHVHPFYEGNGRTSRFLQELIWTSFDMPHGSSGDLMDIDVLTPHRDYYLKAIQKTSEQMDQVEACVENYKQVARHKNIKEIDQSKLNYRCRVLPVIISQPRRLDCYTPVPAIASPEPAQKSEAVRVGL